MSQSKTPKPGQKEPELVTTVNPIRRDDGQVLLRQTVDFLGEEIAKLNKENGLLSVKVESLERENESFKVMFGTVQSAFESVTKRPALPNAAEHQQPQLPQ